MQEGGFPELRRGFTVTVAHFRIKNVVLLRSEVRFFDGQAKSIGWGLRGLGLKGFRVLGC